MELKLGIHTYYISLYINCAFYSSPIRTLVAMATYIFHRFKKGKAKIGNFFLSQWGYLEFIFTEMFIEKSSMLHMAFVQIAEFDWLPGQQKCTF